MLVSACHTDLGLKSERIAGYYGESSTDGLLVLLVLDRRQADCLLSGTEAAPMLVLCCHLLSTRTSVPCTDPCCLRHLLVCHVGTARVLIAGRRAKRAGRQQSTVHMCFAYADSPFLHGCRRRTQSIPAWPCMVLAVQYAERSRTCCTAPGYSGRPWLWERQKANSNWILQFHSDNDPFIPVEEARYVNVQTIQYEHACVV